MDTLLAAQPEAKAWLGLITLVLDECGASTWETAARSARLPPERSASAPLLAGAEVSLSRTASDYWLRRVLQAAGEAGPEAKSLQQAARSAHLDAGAMLEIAVDQDGDRMEAASRDLDVSSEALSVAAGLAALPLLHALRQRYAQVIAMHWHEGFCPLCGDWPLLAEVRGLERTRRLRCGRCGADWALPGARCPFCDAAGHGALASLVPEEGGEARKVETCTHCHGYLKSLFTLRAWASDEIPLADLSSVDLDLVALQRDFTRPDPRALTPGVRVFAVG